jgi:hypothetical protein
MGKIKTPSLDLSGANLLRLAALQDLWEHRSHWRLPLPRALMRRERDTQLASLMPGVIVLALMFGVLLFVILPSALGDAYPRALATLWPVWVVQAAPMIAVQILAMQRAPDVALELTQRHASGEFAALANMRASPAAYPCVSLIVAHAWIVAAASCLLVVLSLLIGAAAGFVLAAGDLRQSIELVLGLVSPWSWLRSLLSALLLGALCSLASVLSAWPGTQTASAGVDAHRLGLRTMIICSLTGVTGALGLHWVLGLFGW